MASFHRFLIFFVIISTLSACTTLDPRREELASVKMQMGVAELQRGDLPLALKILLEAEGINPRDPYIQNNLGLVYFFRKKFDLSILHFSKALDIDAKFTEARNNMGRVYLEIKDYKKAEKTLEPVVEDLTYSNFVSSYNNMGMAKFNLKKYSEALVFFTKSVESRKEDCFSQLYLGRSLLELKRNKLAASRLDLASYYCRQSQIDEAHYYGAIAYYRLGRIDLSLNRFNDVIKYYENGPNKESAREMIQMIEKDLK
jgi:type IV pilus assembly protein PilF